MLEKPDSAFHLDAVGGGVAGTTSATAGCRPLQHVEVRGSFSEIPHVFTSTYRSLWDGVDSAALTLRGLRREAPPTRIRPRRTCSWRSRRAGLRPRAARKKSRHASTSRCLRTGKPLPAMPGASRGSRPLAPSLAAAVAATSRSRNRSTTTRRTCWQGFSSPTR